MFFIIDALFLIFGCIFNTKSLLIMSLIVSIYCVAVLTICCLIKQTDKYKNAIKDSYMKLATDNITAIIMMIIAIIKKFSLPNRHFWSFIGTKMSVLSNTINI